MYRIAEVYRLIPPDSNNFDNYKLWLINRGVPSIERQVSEGVTEQIPVQFYKDYLNEEFETLNEAYEVSETLNKTMSRRTISGIMYDADDGRAIQMCLGYVVYNTESDFYNCYGVNNFGIKVSNSDWELQPLEVVRMACDYFNNNTPLTRKNTTESGDPHNKNVVLRYLYFIPKGRGE